MKARNIKLRCLNDLKKILLTAAFFLVFTGLPLYARYQYEPDKYNKQEAGLPGEYFTNFGASARGFGMGGAYTALSDDSGGPYWNPAGLVNIKSTEISFLSSKLFAGINYNFAGFSTIASSSTFYGVSWAGISIQGIRAIDDSGEYLGDFSDSHNMFCISYARKLSKSMSMGWNIKTTYHAMNNDSHTSFGLDIGVLFHPGQLISAGVCVQNVPPFQPTLKLREQSPGDIFPINLKTGIAFKPKGFILAVDYDILDLSPDKYAFENLTGSGLIKKWHAGMEFNIKKLFFIRAGIDTRGLACGVGINSRKFSIDYALVWHNMGVTNRLQLVSKFGVAPSEQDRYFAEKLLKLDRAKAGIDEERKELDKYRDELLQKEAMLEDIMISAKKVEKQRYRSFNLQNMFDKALELFDEGNLDMAEQKTKDILKIDQSDDGANALLKLINANRLLELSKYQKALKEILEALEIDPYNQRAKEMLKKLKDILLIIE